MEISYFDNLYQNTSTDTISIQQLLNDIKFGRWEKEVDKIRTAKDKEQRTSFKKNVPYVTISGKFVKRKKEDIVSHSGFICLDFDDLEDVDKAFNDICSESFVFSAFKSISGKGIAALVKIDSRKHLEAFLSLEVYFANKYQYFIDRACKDTTRARLVSHDQDLYSNPKSDKFDLYLPKSETQKKTKLPNVIVGEGDMEFIMNQITDSNIDLTDSSYFRWLEVGFAIASEYQESGRQYFHAISQASHKYDSERCDKQYDKCLKSGSSGITIATFFYYAKNAGLSIVSPQTKHIVTVAKMTKNGGRGIHEAVRVLKEVDGISPEVSTDIITKAYKKEDLSESNMLGRIDALEVFLSTSYNLKRNEVTRFIENNNEDVDTNFLNTAYIKARKEIDDKVRFEEIDRLIGSDFTPKYNPLKEFFQKNAHINTTGNINMLARSIQTDTGAGSNYTELFLKKWLVGIISAIHGQHSPLLLALTGGQGTGKTEFFRRLLPAEFSEYYAESKLDAGKDDEILMTQKILILDDEFGGKSKLEAKRLKELTSKDSFTLREPYGRKNVKLKRLAVLAGTSNDDQILNDPTGNRRILPIRILGIDHEQYNKIDKKELFMEAFWEWKKGYKWQLEREDVKTLNTNTNEFEQIRPEKELMLRYFKHPDHNKGGENVEYLQSMEIKARIEKMSGQKISAPKLGQELKQMGYFFENKEIHGQVRRVTKIIQINNDYIAEFHKPEGDDEELPF